MTTRINDNGIDREMTAEELENLAQIKAEAKIVAKDNADRAALKVATLAKLGLTADEVAALLS
jgi:hypothetical protein